MEKCLVIGAAMLDIVVKLDRLPKSGEDIMASSQQMTVGGCAYNVADIMKHLKAPHTLFAPLGTGMYSEFISGKLKAAGHESALRSKDQDNGYCLCMVEADGERTFLTVPGIECSFKREWFGQLNAEEYSCAYVSGYEIEGEGGEAIIEFFEANPNLTLYYAPGPRITYISKEKQERMLALRPALHINEKEALDYTGETDYKKAAQKLYEKTHNAVIITLGSKGVYLKDKEEIFVASEPVKAIDTIGAGDSHIGTIIAMRQKGADYRQALEKANQVSAMVVGVKGPTLTEEEFQKGEI